MPLSVRRAGGPRPASALGHAVRGKEGRIATSTNGGRCKQSMNGDQKRKQNTSANVTSLQHDSKRGGVK